MRKCGCILIVAITVCLTAFMPKLHAQTTFDYSVQLTANTGHGDFAPHLLTTMRGGTITQANSAYVSAGIGHEMDTTKRFSWGFGAELWGGVATGTDYARFDGNSKTWSSETRYPAHFWVEQCFGELKWRSIVYTLGVKRYKSHLLNDNLSSGDLALSANARPAPGLAIGFVDYRDIPLTKGNVQIFADIGYLKMNDGNWLDKHYNYYNHFITRNYWFNYKRIYFRTNPSKRFVFTIGAQAMCQFAGDNYTYRNGEVVDHIKMEANAKAFFRTIVAGSGGENPGDVFALGNHVGTLDVSLDYKIGNGRVIRAYYQNPWEDGSGLQKANGFDGLWGVEYSAPEGGLLKGVVLEFITLKNQSGPLHFNPEDYGGSKVEGKVTGCDNYYNNYAYNGYHAFGLSLGSPFLRSPIYNTDGYIAFTDNLVRGFHVALCGNFSHEVAYRAMLSHQKSWGTPFVLRSTTVSNTSAMLELSYKSARLSGFEMKTQLGFDYGKLYGKNFGALVEVKYSGNFSFGK